MREIVQEAAVYFDNEKGRTLHSRQFTMAQAISVAERCNTANKTMGLKGEYLAVVEHHVNLSN
jgi:hypothetical protein